MPVQLQTHHSATSRVKLLKKRPHGRASKLVWRYLYIYSLGIPKRYVWIIQTIDKQVVVNGNGQENYIPEN